MDMRHAIACLMSLGDYRIVASMPRIAITNAIAMTIINTVSIMSLSAQASSSFSGEPLASVPCRAFSYVDESQLFEQKKKLSLGSMP